MDKDAYNQNECCAEEPGSLQSMDRHLICMILILKRTVGATFSQEGYVALLTALIVAAGFGFLPRHPLCLEAADRIFHDGLLRHASDEQLVFVDFVEGGTA